MAADINYYDIMIIGRTGMGKSTTADKLIIANPDHLNYAGEQHPDEIMEGGQLKMSDLGIWLISDAEDEIERVTTRLKNLVFYRSLNTPHDYVNKLYSKEAKMATVKPQLISKRLHKVLLMELEQMVHYFGKSIF